MTAITVPDEALPIAREAAADEGLDVTDWLARAISRQAAAESPHTEIPYDDCGFYSPYSTPALLD